MKEKREFPKAVLIKGMGTATPYIKRREGTPKAETVQIERMDEDQLMSVIAANSSRPISCEEKPEDRSTYHISLSDILDNIRQHEALTQMGPGRFLISEDRIYLLQWHIDKLEQQRRSAAELEPIKRTKVTFPLELCNSTMWYDQPWVKTGFQLVIPEGSRNDLDYIRAQMAEVSRSISAWQPLRSLHYEVFEGGDDPPRIRFSLRARDEPTCFWITEQVIKHLEKVLMCKIPYHHLLGKLNEGEELSSLKSE